MFDEASSFNQPLNDWNVSNVTTMEFRYQPLIIGCVQRDQEYVPSDSFNQPLNNWKI